MLFEKLENKTPSKITHYMVAYNTTWSIRELKMGQVILVIQVKFCPSQ